jgi:hypothetical protein
MSEPKLIQDPYYDDYYRQLTGASIIGYTGRQEDEYGLSPYPKFLVKLLTGQILTIEVSADEEGNGGGFIFGLPLPQRKDK